MIPNKVEYLHFGLYSQRCLKITSLQLLGAFYRVEFPISPAARAEQADAKMRLNFEYKNEKVSRARLTLISMHRCSHKGWCLSSPRASYSTNQRRFSTLIENLFSSLSWKSSSSRTEIKSGRLCFLPSSNRKRPCVSEAPSQDASEWLWVGGQRKIKSRVEKAHCCGGNWWPLGEAHAYSPAIDDFLCANNR